MLNATGLVFWPKVGASKRQMLDVRLKGFLVKPKDSRFCPAVVRVCLWPGKGREFGG